MAIKNMTGKRFGKIFVISKEGIYGSAQHATWRCLCDCGTQFIAVGASIRAGRTQSCGCQSRNNWFCSEKVITHGMSGSRTYRIWRGILQRCKTVTSKKAHLYALKGISICPEWYSFVAFLHDMGEAPDGMSIDRIDGSLGYCKINCRWATPKQQGNNTSANKILSFDGKTMTASLWADHVGMKPNTLIYRIRRGWSTEEALTTKVQSRNYQR